MKGGRDAETLVYLVQPPFAQLSGPYPGIYYLRSFLEREGLRVITEDHSIGLFERIFCRGGIGKIFRDGEALLAEEARQGGAEKKRGRRVRYYIERFLSQRDLWLSSIDNLGAFLRGQNHEWGHLLALANGSLPSGPRFDAALDSLGGEPRWEDALLLGTKLLEDLADFITLVLDPHFSLVRYLPSLAPGPADFKSLEDSLGGYIMEEFYRPYLREIWSRPVFDRAAPEGVQGGAPRGELVLGVSIPFPGCLPAALVCAQSARKRFGGSLRTIAGGGYVNTELRFMEEGEFFSCFDSLAFDRGYGDLAAFLGLPLEGGDPGGEIFPDYRGVDFSRYLYSVDDRNPMHRLWSGGRWLKCYLAYGCYWHSCSFCDVTLDYIGNFLPVDPERLYRHLAEQSRATGLRGVHLTDEAAPPASLLRLALLNRESAAGEIPGGLLFWGNIRFEKTFTPDAAAILAAGGFLAFSAGIEVASESGFRRTGKGIGLEEVVRVCAAFKEAGILTHGYLIYGYWDGDEQEIIDSAETVRQLFARGLLDSAFWHKFVLTVHSRIYREWQEGRHPALKVRFPPQKPVFTLNDLDFEGEEDFDKYGGPLDSLLAAWMRGETSMPVERAFPFRVKKPQVPPDQVERLLGLYAEERDQKRRAPPSPSGRVVFLGSRPRPGGGGKAGGLRWRWRQGDYGLTLPGGPAAEKIAALLEEASRGEGLGARDFYRRLEEIAGPSAGRLWGELRSGGLAEFSL
jgi:radical SAM superfamily enzyme YgiQ (UPF0313 family)